MENSIRDAVLKTLKEIPDFSVEEIQRIEAEKLPHTMELDITNFVAKIVFVLKIAVFEFLIQEILSKDKGYEQADRTYCIFRYQYEKLKKLNFDNFTPELEAKLNKLALTIISMGLSKLEE